MKKDRPCKECGRVYATYTAEVCKCPDDRPCLDKQIIRDFDGYHYIRHLDVHEVVSWSCPHGTAYTQHCIGCGHKIGSWGIGAAGFEDLCGCENQAPSAAVSP